MPCLLPLLLAIALAATEQAGLSTRLATKLATAQRSYDLPSAELVLGSARQLVATTADRASRVVLAEACLLVAELHRIEFENTPELERHERRRLGELIDRAALEGLGALEATVKDSQSLRIEGDLLGTLIRSRYRGKKYRNRMEAAAHQALELDAGNAKAYVTSAKPLLFRPGRSDDDLRVGLALLDRALELNPNLESALLLRGRGQVELGDLTRALADWQRALGDNPDCIPAEALIEQYAADR